MQLKTCASLRKLRKSTSLPVRRPPSRSKQFGALATVPKEIAEPPIADRAFSPNLTFTGRLKDPKQFEEIVVKAGADGRTVKLRDVARIELGALAYSTNSFLLRKSAVAMLVTQRPGSNALATAKGIIDTMNQSRHLRVDAETGRARTRSRPPRASPTPWKR